MKKKLKKYLNLMLAGAMVLCLGACSGGQSNQSAQFSVQTAMDDLLATVPVEEPLTLSEGDMLDFFGISAERMEEFAAVTCASGITAQEIVLVKAVDEDAADAVAEKLQNRLDALAAQMEDYLPEQYEVVQACQVREDGAYVAMIVHPEHEALEALYADYVSGTKN